jgi:hypothetical protein
MLTSTMNPFKDAPSPTGGEGVHQNANIPSPANSAINKPGDASVVNPVTYHSSEATSGAKPASLQSTMDSKLSVEFGR